jgi:hypothetical protein
MAPHQAASGPRRTHTHTPDPHTAAPTCEEHLEAVAPELLPAEAAAQHAVDYAGARVGGAACCSACRSASLGGTAACLGGACSSRRRASVAAVFVALRCCCWSSWRCCARCLPLCCCLAGGTASLSTSCTGAGICRDSSSSSANGKCICSGVVAVAALVGRWPAVVHGPHLSQVWLKVGHEACLGLDAGVEGGACGRGGGIRGSAVIKNKST